MPSSRTAGRRGRNGGRPRDERRREAAGAERRRLRGAPDDTETRGSGLGAPGASLQLGSYGRSGRLGSFQGWLRRFERSVNAQSSEEINAHWAAEMQEFPPKRRKADSKFGLFF